MANTKKRHHIVSRFHLARWHDASLGDDPRIWVLDKTSLSSKLLHPNVVLVERHYFSEIEPGGKKHSPVEDRLAFEVESPFSLVLRAIESASVVSPSDRPDLWRYITTTFARTVWWREPLREVVERAIEEAPNRTVDQTIANLHLNRAIRRSRKLRNVRSKAISNVKSMPELKEMKESLLTKVHPILVAAAMNLEEELQRYSFTLFIVDGPISLLTSDTPCVFEDPAILDLPPQPGYMFTCPLTPRIAFAGGLHLNNDSRIVGPDWARKFNGRVRANAERLLVASTGDVDESWFLSDPGWPPAFREVAERALKTGK